MGLQIFRPKFKSSNLLSIRKHVFGWAIFITYEIGFLLLAPGKPIVFIDTVIYYILNIVLFYSNAHIVLDYAFSGKPRPYLKAFILAVFEAIIYLVIKFFLDDILMLHHGGRSENVLFGEKFLIANLFRCVYFLGLSTLYWAVQHVVLLKFNNSEAERTHILMLKEKLELENNLSEAKNAYLTHQINPHLFFNTLNFIYNTVLLTSERAAACVLLLSDIMHYSFKETGKDGRNDLKEELAQIKKLIQMNQMRLTRKTYLNFDISGKVGNERIVPLILLTLVENVFKHGDLHHKEFPGKVELTIDKGNLTLNTWNLKKREAKYPRIKTIGIKNVIKRLEYSYKHRYELDISEKEESYSLKLTMQL